MARLWTKQTPNKRMVMVQVLWIPAVLPTLFLFDSGLLKIPKPYSAPAYDTKSSVKASEKSTLGLEIYICPTLLLYLRMFLENVIK